MVHSAASGDGRCGCLVSCVDSGDEAAAAPEIFGPDAPVLRAGVERVAVRGLEDASNGASAGLFDKGAKGVIDNLRRNEEGRSTFTIVHR